jgi:hypothetical protein
VDLQVRMNGEATETKVKTFKAERSQFVASLAPEEKEQIFKIYQRVWGEKGYQQVKRIFSWKFEKNPHLSPNELEVAVYRRQGRIVAFLGAIPYLIKIGERLEKAIWLMDHISLPEFRSTGLWIAYKVWYARPVIVGAPNTEVAYLTWKLMGKRYKGPEVDIGTYRHLVKFIEIDHLYQIKRLLVLRPLVMCANAIWRVFSSVLWSNGSSQRKTSVEIEPVERFGPELDQFWERIYGSYEIIPKRSSDYLNWRYLDHPGNNYFNFVAKRDGQICGYLVLRAVKLRSGEGGRIVDILSGREDQQAFGAMVSFAIDFFKKRGAKEIQALESRCPALKKIFRRLGFKAAFSSQKPLRLMGWAWIKEIPREYFYNGDNWYFTYADCESDMLPLEV